MQIMGINKITKIWLAGDIIGGSFTGIGIGSVIGGLIADVVIGANIPYSSNQEQEGYYQNQAAFNEIGAAAIIAAGIVVTVGGICFLTIRSRYSSDTWEYFIRKI
jgi:hypothetical protein